MPPTNPPAGLDHQTAVQTATLHTDEITKITRDLDAHLDVAWDTGRMVDAVADLDRIIDAATAAKAALTRRRVRPYLTVAA